MFNGASRVSPQGYQGMVDGGSNIVEADWESVSSILQVVRAACEPATCSGSCLAQARADPEQLRVLPASFSSRGQRPPSPRHPVTLRAGLPATQAVGSHLRAAPGGSAAPWRTQRVCVLAMPGWCRGCSGWLVLCVQRHVSVPTGFLTRLASG